MAQLKLQAMGLFYPLPGDMEHLEWEASGENATSVFAVVVARFLRELQEKVPFVVEDHLRVGHLEIEVFICDN